MKIGTIIREKRREQSLTQEQLAGLLGVSASAVHKWEKGTTYPDIIRFVGDLGLIMQDQNQRCRLDL